MGQSESFGACQGRAILCRKVGGAEEEAGEQEEAAPCYCDTLAEAPAGVRPSPLASTSPPPLSAPCVDLPQPPAVSSTAAADVEGQAAGQQKAAAKAPARAAKQKSKAAAKPAAAKPAAAQETAAAKPAAANRKSGGGAAETKQPAAKKKKPKKEEEIVRDEFGRDVKRLEASRKQMLKNAQKEESSDSDFDDLFDCPASKKEKAFEKELKALRKQVRANYTEEMIEELQNPWLNTEVSDSERKLKKDMFISFYREQYGRLKKQGQQAEPDTKQYGDAASNGLKITDGHRPMPRPKGIVLPKDFRKPVGTLTAKQLAGNAADCKRLLLSIHGDIFDVSDRPDKYGADGPYSYMTGHDITWGLVIGDDAEELIDKYYDLYKIQPKEAADKKLQGLMSWWAFFEKEYGVPVGRLDMYNKEWGLPPPPAGAIGNDCSVM